MRNSSVNTDEGLDEGLDEGAAARLHGGAQVEYPVRCFPTCVGYGKATAEDERLATPGSLSPMPSIPDNRRAC